MSMHHHGNPVGDKVAGAWVHDNEDRKLTPKITDVGQVFLVDEVRQVQYEVRTEAARVNTAD